MKWKPYGLRHNSQFHEQLTRSLRSDQPRTRPFPISAHELYQGEPPWSKINGSIGSRVKSEKAGKRANGRTKSGQIESQVPVRLGDVISRQMPNPFQYKPIIQGEELKANDARHA